MKIRIIIVSILFAALAISCEKDKHNVHFHGRIVSDCDDQFPVKFHTVFLHRDYDTGTSGTELLGQTTTDENGYYSMMADVKQKGDFRGYILNIYGPINNSERHFVCHSETNSDTDDIEINGNATTSRAYGFHIKNEFPINSNDVFNFLRTEIAFGNNTDNLIVENLIGINVDTTIYRFYISHPVEFKYSFTKNGIYQQIPIDTITNTGCLDTTYVEIFY